LADETTKSKTDLLRDTEEAWGDLMVELGRLTPQQKSGIKDSQGWTVKDHLVHLAAWERSMISFLQGSPRHEGLGVSADVYARDEYDEINETIYSATKDLTYEEAEAQLRSVHSELMRMLDPMSDEDLQKPYSHYLPDERRDDDSPALDRLYGNTADHFREHLEWIRALVEGGTR
jgi:hypothetical protein